MVTESFLYKVMFILKLEGHDNSNTPIFWIKCCYSYYKDCGMAFSLYSGVHTQFLKHDSPWWPLILPEDETKLPDKQSFSHNIYSIAHFPPTKPTACC